MFALFYTFLYINDVKKRIHVQYWQNRKDRVSEYIILCASKRSERAIFGGFNSFTVKKVSFCTINVKFKVILSSKSGGMFEQAIPPPPKKVGGYIPPSPRDLRQCPPPPPPGVVFRELWTSSPDVITIVFPAQLSLFLQELADIRILLGSDFEYKAIV